MISDARTHADELRQSISVYNCDDQGCRENEINNCQYHFIIKWFHHTGLDSLQPREDRNDGHLLVYILFSRKHFRIYTSQWRNGMAWMTNRQQMRTLWIGPHWIDLWEYWNHDWVNNMLILGFRSRFSKGKKSEEKPKRVNKSTRASNHEMELPFHFISADKPNLRLTIVLTGNFNCWHQNSSFTIGWIYRTFITLIE